MFRCLAWALTLGVLALALAGTAAEDASPPLHRPVPVLVEGAQNVHRLTERVVSGSQPEGDPAFAALAALGVRTIISVDGARPDVAAARRHGLRYVHLPIGYDGVPERRSRELAKAILELPGSTYIHCHHGRHRGPAAAAAACVVAGELTAAEAVADLRVLGTGTGYVQLWEDVRTARRVDAAELRAMVADLPEIAQVPPLAEAMVEIDDLWERLKLCHAAGWRSPPGHPDVTPAHEALQLRERFAEVQRMPDFAARPAEFRTKATQTEAVCARLEGALRDSGDSAVAADAWQELENLCAACHAAFRNGPPRR